MMHAHPFPAAPLPSPRNTLPTLPVALDEYARLSCLPDADDELVFEAGPSLGGLTGRVPYVVAPAGSKAKLARSEALLMSLIDGLSPVGILLQVIGTDPDEALVTMCDLYARGLVAFD